MSRNRADTSCRCGQPLDEQGQERDALMTEDEYLTAIRQEDTPYRDNAGYGWHNDRSVQVLFRRIVCPLCGATYAGWYEPNPMAQWEKPYRIYDSCYYLAFNDEPCELDKPRHPDVVAYVQGLETECAIQVNQIRDMEERIATLEAQRGNILQDALERNAAHEERIAHLEQEIAGALR